MGQDSRWMMLMIMMRDVRHRNIRCRTSTCIRYRMSDVTVRHRMYLIVYDIACFDLHIVRSCIQHRIQHGIRHRVRLGHSLSMRSCCSVHSIGFGAGFRGFKLHARSRRHRSLHGNVFIQASTAPPAAAA